MKNIGAIRLLLAANFISGIAQGISMISIPTYFAQTQQTNWFSSVYILITAVSLFWSLYSGTLIDKYNRKNIFLGLNLFNGVAIGAIAFLEGGTAGFSHYWAASVFALTFWNYGLHYPCFYAFMQEITEKEHYNKIASYIEVQSQLASALAGAGAALLLGGGMTTFWFSIEIEPWTLSQIFALDASTYLIGFAIIFTMRFVPISKREEETGSVLERLKLGTLYLKNEPYIFLFGVLSYSVFVVVLLHVFNLAPLYVEQHLQVASQNFAISEIFYALGAILAGLGIHKLFGKMRFTKAIIILTLITVLELVCMAWSEDLWLFFIMSFLLGTTNAGIRVIRMSYLFRVLPNQVMGRANSIFFLINVITRIIFLFLISMSFFHHSGNVIYAFLILAAFLMLSVLGFMVFYSKIAAASEK